jgi:hypothetical protein
MEITHHSWKKATTSCQMDVSKLDVEMITPLPDRITINEGDQLKLFCETSNENMKPKWYHNEIYIEPNNLNNRELYLTATQHYLTIYDAKQNDFGIYKIKLSPSQEYRTTVVVNKRKQKLLKDDLNLIKPLLNIVCNEGESITLFCRVNRPIHDNDVIEWRKNKIPLINATGVNVDKFDSNVLVNRNCEVLFNNNECGLILHNALLSDAATYEISIIENSNTNKSKVIESKANVQLKNMKNVK